MAAKPYPSAQYFAPDFVVSAGCVLFRRREAPEQGLEICILRSRTKDKPDDWILPKGRKDCGEDVAAAAVRETFEETGYKCALVPLRMATRAPFPGLNAGPDVVNVVDGIREPFSVVVRELAMGKGVKIVWWFVARATTRDRMVGTQEAWEAYDTEWVVADEAAERLTFQSDRDIVNKALELVKKDGNEEAI
ncbi:NUDIX hydrolase domain-like protein [Mycena alexandri]|uniref:NUDIX hydrolase domain-like protein n=1 Tax=Mycena alexandri TaxID=1745969 RepID=A0AAD6SW53_9AGAR|nr:NUDIX hydrolase domain-like protein [Mycena alexandri]